MKQLWKSGLAFLLVLVMVLALAACGGSRTGTAQESGEAAAAGETTDLELTGGGDPSEDTVRSSAEPAEEAIGYAEEDTLPEDGQYTTKEDVALYLHLYGHLPDNFLTKKEAQALGWSGGSLEPYAPGCSIGGSRFGNYEGLLPEKQGRTYQECDIDTMGAKRRGAKRIVWSNDGLIYYTGDHYESFTLLYGEE